MALGLPEWTACMKLRHWSSDDRFPGFHFGPLLTATDPIQTHRARPGPHGSTSLYPHRHRLSPACLNTPILLLLQHAVFDGVSLDVIQNKTDVFLLSCDSMCNCRINKQIKSQRVPRKIRTRRIRFSLNGL